MSYAVIALENYSDFPGFIASWGSFESYEDADKFANETAYANGVIRGEQIQVTLLESPNLQTNYGLEGFNG